MPKKTVIVVGGGIAGLSACYFLSQQRAGDFRVLLVEKTGKLGGAIRTMSRDGFLIEEGPEAFAGYKPAAVALCKELSLEHELISPNPEHREVFCFLSGQLQPIPDQKSLRKLLKKQFGNSTRSFMASPESAKEKTPSLLSLKSGLEALPLAIISHLRSCKILLNAEVKKIKKTKDKFQLIFNHQTASCDFLLLATPAFVSAAILRDLDPRLSSMLQTISYTSSTIVTFGFAGEPMLRLKQGSGFLTGDREKISLKACTVSSHKWPDRAPKNKLLLRGYLPGIPKDPEKAEQTALRELKEILGIKSRPLFSRVNTHPDSMPQYQANHQKKVKKIKALAAKHPGLFLLGNAYDGIGIPDCIQSAQTTAKKILAGDMQK